MWLDRDWMMYTCAYWKEGTAAVEEAQQNKIEHVCRKIRLKPGESVVDIGCGFGGFMLYAVQRHGVHGAAVNTTNEQVDWLRDEVARRGLSERIDVRLADFREVHAQFDKVVSIGVLEHAGRDQLREVVKAHADFLKPGGLGMLHFIGHVGVFDTEFFIRKHVFPGGWIPSLAETITAMEECGLEVVDIENLRRHYAFTLDAWAERFDANWARIHALDPKRFDERFRRIWRTYLYGCAEHVPRGARPHAPLPDRVQQGQRRHAQLPDEPRVPLRREAARRRRPRGAGPRDCVTVASMNGFAARRERLVAELARRSRRDAAAARQVHLQPLPRPGRGARGSASTSATSITCSRSTRRAAGSTSRA